MRTGRGRVSSSDRALVVTARGERQERPLDGEEAFAAALREHFGIRLD